MVMYDMLTLIRAADMPEPVREYRFHPVRLWAFDYAWPAHMLALEIEGGNWTRGRHTRGKGYEEDCRKYNEAAILGWRVIRITPSMANRGELLNYLERALKGAAA